MKKQVVIFFLPFMLSCVNNKPDGMYEGPVVNANCALDVFPPKVEPGIEQKVDSVKKEDPLLRQNGLGVCRSF